MFTGRRGSERSITTRHPDCTFDLDMAEQELSGSQITSTSVDQGCLGPRSEWVPKRCGSRPMHAIHSETSRAYEPDVKPDRLLDDFGREVVAAIADLGHHRWLRLKVIDGKPNGDVTIPSQQPDDLDVAMAFHLQTPARADAGQQGAELCGKLGDEVNKAA